MKEYELAVIGTILDAMDRNAYALTIATGSLVPDDFEDQLCRAVFRGMQKLHEEETPVDVLTLQEHFTKNPFKDHSAAEIAGFLLECSGQHGSVAHNIQHYIEKVVEAAEERRTEDVLKQALDYVREGRLQEVADTIQQGHERLAQVGKMLPSMAVRIEVAGLPEKLLDRDKADRPIPTFSETLNRNLNGGLQRGRFMVWTAPAGGGKTTLLLQLADEIAKAGTLCLFVALEMAELELWRKSLARIGEFNSGLLEAQNYLDAETEEQRTEEDRELLAKVGQAIGLYKNDYADNMYVWEAEGGLDVKRIQAEVTKLQYHRMRRDNLEELPAVVACIDPLHALSTGDNVFDADPIGKAGRIAGDLKRMARTLNIPVVGLSDTSQDATRRVEGGEKIGQTGFRYSYEIVHRADVTGEVRMGKDLAVAAMGKRAAGSTDQDKAEIRDAYARIQASNPLEDFKDTEAIYAVLDLSKQRSGAKRPALFVYERAFQRFTPIGRVEEDGSF